MLKLSKFRYTDRYVKLSNYFDDDSFNHYQDAEEVLLKENFYNDITNYDDDALGIFPYITTLPFSIGKPKFHWLEEYYDQDYFPSGNLNPTWIGIVPHCLRKGRPVTADLPYTISLKKWIEKSYNIIWKEGLLLPLNKGYWSGEKIYKIAKDIGINKRIWIAHPND